MPSEEIAIANQPWTYRVYLPKVYEATRKWPILFVLDPEGGTASTLSRYTLGADFNGWILAVSVQSKDDFAQSKEAAMAMIKDVMRRLPVDPGRLYVSGFASGSKLAYSLASGMRGCVGILACGAAGSLGNSGAKPVVYGLCGANSFARWEMACAARTAKNKNSRLTFFAGDHTWADPTLLAYAMTWLNCCYLSGPTARSPALLKEKQELIQDIGRRVSEYKADSPDACYEWALCLSLLDTSAAGRKQFQELLKRNRIATYVAALKEMDQFVSRNFATNPLDYQNEKKNGNPRTKKAAEELSEKYRESVPGISTLFARMAEASVMP